MCFPYLTYKSTCSTLKIMVFRFYILDWFLSFGSYVWLQKSDVIRASYKLFHLLTGSCVCIPHLWHKFSFWFISHAATFKINFFRVYIIDCSVSFNSRVWTQIFNIIRHTSFLTYKFGCLIWRTGLLSQLPLFDVQVFLFDFRN